MKLIIVALVLALGAIPVHAKDLFYVDRDRAIELAKEGLAKKHGRQYLAKIKGVGVSHYFSTKHLKQEHLSVYFTLGIKKEQLQGGLEQISREGVLVTLSRSGKVLSVSNKKIRRNQVVLKN